MVITFSMIQKTLGKQSANFFLFLQEEGHIITTKDVLSNNLISFLISFFNGIFIEIRL